MAEVEGVLGIHMACSNEWNSFSGSLVKNPKMWGKMDVFFRNNCDYKDGEMIFGPHMYIYI